MTRRSYSAALLAGLAALAGAGWLMHARQRVRNEGPRIALVDLQPGPGMGAAEAMALGVIIQDHLETLGDAPVVSMPEPPLRFPPSRGPAFLIRGTASRQGDLLGLEYRWCRLEGTSPEGAAWTPISVPPSPPAQAVQQLLGQLPVRLAPSGATLLPNSPPAFWDLLRATGSLFTNTSVEDAVMVGHRAMKDAPDCATAHFTVAILSYHQMLEDPTPFDTASDLVDAAFRKGLDLAPNHPRGLMQYCRTKSDAGRQKEALELLKPAFKRHPSSIDLLWALDYAARTSGLLDLAVASRRRMNEVHDLTGRAQPLAYAYLYAGRLDLFEQSLWESRSSMENALIFLERGYLFLIKGDRAAAHAAFQRAEHEAAAQKHVSLLAKCFRLQLEDRSAEARASLAELDRQRTGMRVPDGEFTFSMAEAAAFQGEEGLAMDLAHRAFSQGFACAAWYEHSPLLRSLQALPRWKALLQHVRERQARLEAQFAAKDFGL
ncbi:MAG TPA: hypothetical protein VJ483_04060 [Holophagaceae bacterium]|nr:hypothetical protein [Holophagaceae bacterium]